MVRSSKLLVAMQGKGVFVIDLAERSVISGLHDCIVVAPGPDNGETLFAGTDKGQYKSIDGGRNWQLKGLEQYKIFSLRFIRPIRRQSTPARSRRCSFAAATAAKPGRNSMV
jgi:hypothetical protein